MKKFTLRIFAILAICAFVVAACAPVEETPTEAPPVEEPPMIDEVVEEEMPELVPVSSLTTGSQAVITRENAGDLKQIEYIEKGSINNMAWSPLGSPIALATTTGIYLVDPQTYQEGHFTKTAADHIAFSPDGTYLASTQGSRIILHDLRSESEPRVIEGHSDISSIAFSPTENLLASASYDGTIKVWDLASGEERASLDKTGAGLHDLAFSRDGQILASAAYLRESDHSEIILWDVDNAVEILPESKIEVGAVLAVSPTSETIATGGFFNDVPLRLLDFNGQVRLTLDEESEWVGDLIFSPDGKILASITQIPSSWDTTLKMWDTASGKLLHTLDDEGEYYLVSFSPDGSQIAAASVDRVKLWDVESGQDIAVVTDSVDISDYSKLYGYDIAWSPDGNTLARAAGGAVILFNLQTRKEIQLTTHGDHPQIGHVISFSPDGNLLAVSNYKRGDTFRGRVDIFDVVSQELLLTLDDFEEIKVFSPFGIAFSPDGAILATGNVNSWGGGLGGVKLWDVFSGALIDEISQEGLATILNLTFDKEGRLLAGISENGSVYIWDIATGEAIQHFQGTSGYGGAVAFSPDNRLLAVGGAASDGRSYDYEPAELRLFDVTTGELVHQLEGHQAIVRSLSFSADGSVLGSASWDETVRLWDVETGQQLATLDVRGPASVRFSPDGTLLATAGFRDVMRLWGTP